METDIKKFMEYIRVIDKDFSSYEDKDKGVVFICNTVSLLAKCEYLELDKKQYEAALFQKQVEKLDYEIKNIKRAVPKNEITKKEEDKFTITEKEVAIHRIWKVSNAIGVFKCFVNKDEAIEYTNKINSTIFKNL